MIYFIGIILCIACWVVFIKFKDNYKYENLAVAGLLSGVVTTAGVFLMTILIIVQVLSAPGSVASGHQTYDSLVHQVESGMYNNDNEYGKKELANQVQEWNEDLAEGKALQKNFWVGIFYPNIYDEFEFIPIENLK
jgi:hypothetical protein